MAKKSCKKGYYYCYASKKCKKIPMGYIVGMGGWLRREKEEEKSSDETEGKKKNGNGNGANGNGNGNGGSDGGSNGGGVSEAWSAKYKKSIDCDNPKGFSQRAHCRGRKMNEAKGGDHEVAMAQSQLKKSATNIAKLRKALGKKEKDIPAWMQAKITDTAHDTDAAAGYVDKMDEEFIAEKRDGKSAKSKGYSLRDWFKGGGWVQAGGKYDGKPCAKQPGQKTKPFCRDADDRANMSKKERERRAKKKRREDPNPNRRGPAKMVSASYSNWRADLEQLDEIAPAIAAGAALGIGAGGMYMINKLRQQKKKSDQGQGDGGLVDRLNKRKQMLQQLGNSYQPEGEVVTERDAWGTGPMDIIKCADGICRTPQEIEKLRQQNLKKKVITLDKAHYEPEGELVDEEGRSVFSTPGLDRKKKVQDYLKNTDKVLRPQKPTVELDKAHFEPEGDLVDEGKKDACYHKVKSRYSVWPSAYASGALVKCRKVGAKNWGNKTKKEGYEFSNWRDDFKGTEYESVDIIKAEPLKPTNGIGSRMLDEKKDAPADVKGIAKELDKAVEMHKSQAKRLRKAGISEENIDEKCWKGYEKKGMKTMFGKRYPNCVKKKKTRKEEVQVVMQHFSDWRADMELQEDWQKSNRNDGVDGMSQKSVDAYKRENPGSKLKTAVTGKVKKGSKDAKRRKSFCSRSKGQKDMHNIDCKKTPEKKICKARKRWRC